MHRGDLEDLRNIGPTSARRLREVGIGDEAALRRTGAAAAFAEVRASYPLETSENLLWALHGAIADLDWRDLTAEDKERLRAEADAHGAL